MVIGRKGIQLLRLTEDHIELVRQKRNMPEIQKRMEYREYITPQMQQAWFTSVNNINNHYFVIKIGEALIGLVSAADIDWQSGTVHNGGIFIWDENYLQTPEALQASLLLTDFGFYIGIKKNQIRILKDNEHAIAFNKGIGYKLVPGQDDVYNQKYELTESDYFAATGRIRQQDSVAGKIKVTFLPDEYAVMKNVIDFSNKHINNILFEIEQQ